MPLQSLSKALSRLEWLRHLIEDARGKAVGSRTIFLRLQSLPLRQQERLVALVRAGTWQAAPVRVPARTVDVRAMTRLGNR
jgi:hypothetical protein